VLCAGRSRAEGEDAQAEGSAKVAAKRQGRAGYGEASSPASRPVSRRRAVPGAITACCRLGQMTV
jgi:hypothetical protein